MISEIGTLRPSDSVVLVTSNFLVAPIGVEEEVDININNNNNIEVVLPVVEVVNTLEEDMKVVITTPNNKITITNLKVKVRDKEAEDIPEEVITVIKNQAAKPKVVIDRTIGVDTNRGIMITETQTLHIKG
jgi:hypothetical protein